MKLLILGLILQSCSTFSNRTCVRKICRIEPFHNNRFIQNRRICYCTKWVEKEKNNAKNN